MSEPSTSADNPVEKASPPSKKEEPGGSGGHALLEPPEGKEKEVVKKALKPLKVEQKAAGEVPQPEKMERLKSVKVEPGEGGAQEKPAKKATKRKRPSTEAEEGKSVDEANEEKKKRRRERSQAASIVCQYQHPNGAEAVMVQCKQRAILGFRFCIRHILQDSEAPYQQCAHQKRPKNKNDAVTRCTNAIRKDSNETFCSTHLIMQGLKEAKKKPQAGTEEGNDRSTPHDVSDVASPGQNPLHGSSGTSPTEVLSPLCQDVDLPRALPIVKREPLEPGLPGPLSNVKRELMEPGPMAPLSVTTVKSENSHLMRALSSPGGFSVPPQVPQVQQLPPQMRLVAPMPSGLVPPGHMPPGRGGLPPGQPMQRILIQPKLEPGQYPGPQPPQQGPQLPQQHPQQTLQRPQMRMPPVHSVPSTSAGFTHQQQEFKQMPPQPPVSQPAAPPPQPPVGKLSCSELLLRMTPAQKAVFDKFRQARAQRTAQAPARAERTAVLKRLVPQKVGGRPRKLNSEHVARVDRILSKISPQARQLWSLSLTSRTGQRMVHQRVPFPVQAVEKVNLPMAKRLYQLARKRIPRVGVRSNPLFDNSKLPTTAPPIRPQPSSSDDEDPELSGGQPRVIKLRHKGQVRKMVGPYREVAVVAQMCDKLEDADYDETDLFPLGMEPSDEEYDGLSSSLSVIHPTGMTLTADYKEPLSELYLLRKQLRLERHQLLKTAQLNASIMKSAKLFPVSTGAALRQRGEDAPLPPQILINTLKRCCQIESKQRCQRSCQPNSNHCNMHVLYNVHQKIYEFCKQSGCRRPVLCVDSHLWDGMCRLHRDSRLEKYGEYPIYADTELPQARAYSRLSSKTDSEDGSDSEMEEDGDAPRGDDFDEMEDDDEGSVGTP